MIMCISSRETNVLWFGSLAEEIESTVQDSFHRNFVSRVTTYLSILGALVDDCHMDSEKTYYVIVVRQMTMRKYYG